MNELLRQRFPAEEYALFFEVPNATGARATNYADAIVISLWPSRGLTIHGFEVKASRGDWLRELKQPAKAESVARYCDRWSLAVSDPDIVKAGELPSTWGLWAPRGKTLTCIKEAAPLQPKPIDRVFLAALARSAQKMASKTIARSSEEKEIARRLKLQREEFDIEVEQRVRARVAREAGDLAGLQQAVAEFEKRSGIQLSSNLWSVGRLGEAVRAIREIHSKPALALRSARDHLETALAAVKAVEESKTIGASESLL